MAIQGITEVKENFHEKVQEVQKSRISEVWQLFRRAQKNISSFARTISSADVAASSHVLRDFAGSVLHATEPLWKGSKVVALSLRCLKLSMFLSGPFALMGMKSAYHKWAHEDAIQGKVEFVLNLGWFADAMTTVTSGLLMLEQLPSSSKALCNALVTPLSITAGACGLFGTYCYWQGYKGYKAQAEKINDLDAVKKLQGSFDLENYEAKEEDIPKFKDRLFAKAFSYKLKVLATTVTIVGVGALACTPLNVIPSLFFATSGLIDLGSIVYDKWAENRLEKSLGLEQSQISRLAFGAGAVALVALPAIMAGSVLKSIGVKIS